MYKISDAEFVKLIEGNVPLTELEKRLRPGNSSQAGFIGQNENLIELVHSDWQIVEKYGTTHEEIADKLTELIINSREKKNLLTKLFFKNNSLLAEEYDYLPANLLTMGSQSCPWGCKGVGGQNNGYIVKKGLSKELKVGIELLVSVEGDMAKLDEFYQSINKRAPNSKGAQEIRKTIEEIKKAQEQSLRYAVITSLLPHLIEAHHFFEGKQSHYRADPELLIKVLNIGK